MIKAMVDLHSDADCWIHSNSADLFELHEVQRSSTNASSFLIYPKNYFPQSTQDSFALYHWLLEAKPFLHDANVNLQNTSGEAGRSRV